MKLSLHLRQNITLRRVLVAAWPCARIGVAILLLLGLYVTRIEPYWIQVNRVDVPIANLPPALKHFTIVQLSDLHWGLEPGEKLLPQAIAQANAERPDLIVLTGDYVDAAGHEHVAEYAQAVASQLAGLRARYGVYAVIGNHDRLSGEDVIVEQLQQVGILVLRDAKRPLQVGSATIWLIGVEDNSVDVCHSWGDLQADFDLHIQNVHSLLAGVPSGDIRLLLVHNPDVSEIDLGGRIDLALAGHTHGGYARLPFIGAPMTSSCFGNRLVAGLVQGTYTRIYINQGLGGLSVRLGDRPEVTVLRLVSE